MKDYCKCALKDVSEKNAGWCSCSLKKHGNLHQMYGLVDNDNDDEGYGGFMKSIEEELSSYLGIKVTHRTDILQFWEVRTSTCTVTSEQI